MEKKAAVDECIVEAEEYVAGLSGAFVDIRIAKAEEYAIKAGLAALELSPGKTPDVEHEIYIKAYAEAFKDALTPKEE